MQRGRPEEKPVAHGVDAAGLTERWSFACVLKEKVDWKKSREE